MAQKFQRVDDSSEQNEEGATRGPKSTIAFPYGDLDMAIGVARTIWTNSGRHQCAIHQLSSWLGHDSLSSGAFRLKFTTARIFGLIEVNGDQVILTKLGRDILDPNLERQARTESFLQVPLFKELYEKHKGYTLPSDIGLEREIEGLGVTPKQKDKARQAFQRSALQAGFFEQGRNKLVLPSGLETTSADNSSRNTRPLTSPPPPTISTSPLHSYRGDGGDNSGPQGPNTLQEHSLIRNLYVLAPPVGSQWPRAKREAWLALLATVIHSLYSDDEQG